jgi:hypothetical protein
MLSTESKLQASITALDTHFIIIYPLCSYQVNQKIVLYFEN